MLQILIVVFREIVEISLIIGILSAATKGVEGRKKWIISGVLAGILSSVLLAFSTDKISQSLDGAGQEIFNGAVLMAAAVMISWTVIWMQKHARNISGEFKTLKQSIEEGVKPPYSLAIVVFLSVLREGSEIVLFTYSYYLSGTSTETIILGAFGGIIIGAIFGYIMYKGLIKILGKYFFKVTTWILIFLACSLTLQGFGFWVNAGIIDPIIYEVWNSSDILSSKSIFGEFLKIFFGYVERPSLIQILAYITNLVIVLFGLNISKKVKIS